MQATGTGPVVAIQAFSIEKYLSGKSNNLACFNSCYCFNMKIVYKTVFPRFAHAYDLTHTFSESGRT